MAEQSTGKIGSYSEAADLVRAVAAEAVGDAVQIRGMIALLRAANSNGIYEALRRAGAGTAAWLVQQSLITRLLIWTTRSYSKARDRDRHAQRAFDLMKDPGVRQQVARRSGRDNVEAVLQSWECLRSDNRLHEIQTLRNNEFAHLGKPVPKLARPIVGEFFGFCDETAEVLIEFAVSVGVVFDPNLRMTDYEKGAIAFWDPWSDRNVQR